MLRRTLSLVAGVVLAAGLVAVGAAERTEAQSPVVATTTTTAAPTTTTTTAPPTTTATAAPAPAPAETTGPVSPPGDEYAYEPHVVVGRIVIPKLGLDVPLNQGISLRSIDRGPSHWPGTALPGEAGNVVVAGHRVTNTRPFRHIDSLQPGDEIRFEVDGTWHTYRVREHEVVTPDAMHIVMPTDTPTVTLFACHPPGSAKYRYVVYGDLVT